MTFICGNCFSELEADQISKTRVKIHCLTCGSSWYIDDEEEGFDLEDKLEITDAALLWSIHDKSKEYLFGYTEEELQEICNTKLIKS